MAESSDNQTPMSNPSSTMKRAGASGIGTKGLEQYGGRINEEWLRRLQGDRAEKVYREMADNDDTVGAILFAIEMLLRNVDWRVEAFSDDPVHQDQAEFVETLMDDMEIPWSEFITECLSFLVYGYAPFEILYKRRGGPFTKNRNLRSNHEDSLIGWRQLAIRAQSTVERWEFDDEGAVLGLWQSPPYGTIGGKSTREVFIPIEKMLLFRTSVRRGNPEGRSILRNAFVSWFHKKRIAEAEAIGAERDLAGLPVFFLPSEYFDPDNDQYKAQLTAYRTVVENLKKDEQAGLLLPSMFDDNGNRLVEFKLMGNESTRLIDTDKVIKRYDVSIARTVMADFIMLGHSNVGSYALSDDKTQMFSTAVGAWLKSIGDVLNRQGLVRLYELNGWNPAETAQLVSGDIEKADIEKFTQAIERLTGAGFLTPGREEDENHLRSLVDLPEIPEGEERPTNPNQPDESGSGEEP